MPMSGIRLSDRLHRGAWDSEPCSGTGENRPHGVIGGIEETSSPGRRLDPTRLHVGTEPTWREV